MQVDLHKHGVMFGAQYDFLTSTFLVEMPLLNCWQHEANLYDLAEVFHENTKMGKSFTGRVGSWVAVFARPDVIKAVSHIFPTYSKAERILLPTHNMEMEKRIDEVISGRRSVRSFLPEPVTLEELSKLLYYGNGITCCIRFPELQTGEEIIQHFRASPSGGGLFPVDLYVAALNVEGLKEGVYHYNVLDHVLEVVNCDIEHVSAVVPQCFSVPKDIIDVASIPVIFIMTSTFWRTMAKYGPRGYRYILQESGHIAQNLYLAAGALNLGCVAVEAFYDDEINALVGVDGVEQAAIYTVFVGKPSAQKIPVEPLKAGQARRR